MLGRRTFAIGLILAAGLGRSRAASAYAEERVALRIRADDALVDKTVPMIVRRDLSIEADYSDMARRLAALASPGRAVPVIVIIAGLMAIPLWLEMIKELVRQKEYGGVIVDARQSPVLTTHDPSIPANMVLIVDQKGTVAKYDSTVISADLLGKVLKK